MKITQKIVGIFIFFFAKERPIQYIKLWEATEIGANPALYGNLWKK